MLNLLQPPEAVRGQDVVTPWLPLMPLLQTLPQGLQAPRQLRLVCWVLSGPAAAVATGTAAAALAGLPAPGFAQHLLPAARE